MIPKLLIRRELSDADAANELIVTDTMRERKHIMEERAEGFIVLPGGLGTLDELLDAWTTGYLGMHRKPIVILDPWGHYDGLLAWLNGLVNTGYVAQVAMERLTVVDKVSAALELCAPSDRPWAPRPSILRSEWRENVSDHQGGGRARVKLTDVAARVPGVLADTPSIVRGL
ncbi:hypothetical protein NIIDMKKI_16510 [Mycobacterium kansasii]|uniref:Cytokinin riboside 5'-monophosphate phosphoribohydrolase n=1 Tax=Mycobacterium kansasii TaxID=1768 RepID=A0A7G1I9J4_MYCKA|nr:hypothetical protein NIIDMKKI_16510 [Mycobacterium kansasii]